MSEPNNSPAVQFMREEHERQRSAASAGTLDKGLGSGLIDQSQKITVAARAMAEKKTIGHLS